MTTPDPVEQARSWLTGRVGVPVPEGAPAPAPGPRRQGHPSDPGGEADPGDASESTESELQYGEGRTGRRTGPYGSGRTGSRRSSSGRGAGRDRSRRAGSSEAPGDPLDSDADPEDVARTIALRKLTGQARTRRELDQAMQKKNVPDEVAATVLDRLEEVGLIDDEAFAQSWVESRQQRRYMSRSALRRELQSKGVDRDHVDAAVATVDADDELSAARALAAKKAAATRRLDPLVRQRRLAGVLARRGFGSGIIATVLGELRDEWAADPDA